MYQKKSLTHPKMKLEDPGSIDAAVYTSILNSHSEFLKVLGGRSELYRVIGQKLLFCALLADLKNGVLGIWFL